MKTTCPFNEAFELVIFLHSFFLIIFQHCGNEHFNKIFSDSPCKQAIISKNIFHAFMADENYCKVSLPLLKIEFTGIFIDEFLHELITDLHTKN